jgi:hypothetical protein
VNRQIKRPLQVQRETLRVLNPSEMARANGGEIRIPPSNLLCSTLCPDVVPPEGSFSIPNPNNGCPALTDRLSPLIIHDRIP